MSKILSISHIFPPAVDGGSRVIYQIGQYFKSCGDEILYLSSNCSSTDDFAQPKHKKSSTIHDLPSTIYLPVYHHLRRPLKFINLFLPSKSYLSQLLQVFQKGPIFKFFPFIKAAIQILKFKPDLIIAGPLPTTIILYAKLIQKIISNIQHLAPKILINSSFHPTDPDFHRLPLIKTLQSADYLWTLTQYETDYFIQNFKINPDKIILAGNGVDQSLLLKKPKTNIQHLTSNILFIGSLSAHKGLNTLIKSFSMIYDLPSTKLVIAGQKTLNYPKIQQQIKKLPKNIQSKIRFIFNFPQNKLAKIIDDCDILVLPSKQESFGLVLIEAWARQKPVIVSHIPSLSEIVTSSKGGLIFNLDDPISLKQKIIKLTKNPTLYNQLSQNGFNYVTNNYTWRIVGRKIQKKLSL